MIYGIEMICYSCVQMINDIQMTANSYMKMIMH